MSHTIACYLRQPIALYAQLSLASNTCICTVSLPLNKLHYIYNVTCELRQTLAYVQSHLHQTTPLYAQCHLRQTIAYICSFTCIKQLHMNNVTCVKQLHMHNVTCVKQLHLHNVTCIKQLHYTQYHLHQTIALCTMSLVSNNRI